MSALDGTYSLPLFGSGLILALAVGFLVALGSLAELAKHLRAARRRTARDGVGEIFRPVASKLDRGNLT